MGYLLVLGVVIAIVLVIDLGVALSVLSKAANRMSSFDQGHFTEGVFGPAIIAIIVAGALDISHRKKLRASQQLPA